MESEPRRDILDENLRKLLDAAREEDSGFQARLLNAVQREVRKERSSTLRKRIFAGLSAAAAMAAVLALTWFLVSPGPRSAGRLQSLYGKVEVADGQGTRVVASGEPILTGSSIRTLPGSKAQLQLTDGSQLTLAPRTMLQIIDGRRGPAARLRAGTVSIEAAKQQGGRKLMIETPGSQITTLGTVFDVQLSTKPDGTRRTRVGVTSGLVEFESGGHKVRLPARTEGIAEEGQSPEKRLANFELNELLQLIRRNEELAGRSNKEEGSPAIIRCQDSSTAVIWTVIHFRDLRETGDGDRLLRLKSPALRARLYTLDGRSIPAQGRGLDLRIDASSLDSDASQDARLILELRDVKGIFQTDSGVTWFKSPAGASDVVTLLRFDLPESARIGRLSPEPLESTRALGRLAVTIAADIEGLEVVE